MNKLNLPNRKNWQFTLGFISFAAILSALTKILKGSSTKVHFQFYYKKFRPRRAVSQR
jgi:hypothetical protein